jgi:hypothetical protein
MTELVHVQEVLDKNTCVISAPLMDIVGMASQRLDARLEKVDLKCSLTFKISLLDG